VLRTVIANKDGRNVARHLCRLMSGAPRLRRHRRR
jgi:hypothetical protein